MKTNPFAKIAELKNTYLKCDGEEVYLCSTNINVFYIYFPTDEKEQVITDELLESVEIIGKNKIKFLAPMIADHRKIELEVFILTPAEIF